MTPAQERSAMTFACCPCCLDEEDRCLDGYHDDHEIPCTEGCNSRDLLLGEGES